MLPSAVILCQLKPLLPACRGVTFTRCADVMVRNFDVRCSLVHDVGTDTGSKWSVVMVGAAQRRPAALSPCGMVAAVREASGFLRQAVL
jgi:hypothetical protein